MKIVSIDRIKDYKSYKDYNWKNWVDKPSFGKVNIFYGENGSGKSAICNIFKSYFNIKKKETMEKGDFLNNEKAYAKLTLLNQDGENIEVEVENKEWKKIEKNLSNEDQEKKEDNVKNKESTKTENNPSNENLLEEKNKQKESDFLCFDWKFIKKNIHQATDRGTKVNGQEQNSTDLLIDFDEVAINKKRKLNEDTILLEETKDKKKEIEKNKRFNQISDYEEYFSYSKEKIDEKRNKLDSEKDKKRKELINNKKKLENLKLKQIKFNIGTINTPMFSNKTIYESLLFISLKIKEKEIYTDLIEENKEFFNLGFEMWKINKEKCPFCQSKDRKNEIEAIKRDFDKLYDDKYKQEETEWNNGIKQLDKELESFISWNVLAEINNIENKLKQVDANFGTNWIKEFNELSNLDIPSKKHLWELKTIVHSIEFSSLDKDKNKEKFNKIYDNLSKKYNLLKNQIIAINEFIKAKKQEFEKMFNKQEIDDVKKEITSLESSIEKIENTLKKLDIEIIEELKELNNKYDSINLELKRREKNRKSSKEDFNKYCGTTIFQKHIKLIEHYFEKFNFNFKIKLVDAKKRGNLRYSFQIFNIDDKNNEIPRTLNEGLSEGELQLLSLCFFLAFIECSGKIKNKILVFDDPINSLDKSIIFTLVNILKELSSKCAQLFVFTHHSFFNKLLNDTFRNQNEHKKYSIYRNWLVWGGSFIVENNFDPPINKLIKIVSDFNGAIKKNNEKSSETVEIEWGQFLRYSVEDLVINDILQENSTHFKDKIDNYKKTKKLKDKDLDDLYKIYSFCSKTSIHITKENSLGLRNLLEQINLFLEIIKLYFPKKIKIKNAWK